jgi:hypothetical protein
MVLCATDTLLRTALIVLSDPLVANGVESNAQCIQLS